MLASFAKLFTGNRTEVGSIGLEFGLERLNLLQLQRGVNGIEVRAGISVPYPESLDKMLASQKLCCPFIRHTLAAGGFKGNRVVSCLPGDATSIFNLGYRHKGDQSEDEIIVTRVMESMPGERADYVIDCLKIRGNEKYAVDKAALVAVCKREVVMNYLRLLTRAGLEVEALDVGPSALRRLVAVQDTKKEFPSILLINFGRVRSFLTVIAGRRFIVDESSGDGDDQPSQLLILDREIDFGEQKLVEQLSRNLQISDRQALALLYRDGFAKEVAGPGDELGGIASAEIGETIMAIMKPLFLEFVDEVAKVISYTASETRGGEVVGVHLLGSVARYSWARNLLAEMIALPVDVMNPFASFKVNDSVIVDEKNGSLSGMAVATGLALRGELFDVC